MPDREPAPAVQCVSCHDGALLGAGVRCPVCERWRCFEYHNGGMTSVFMAYIQRTVFRERAPGHRDGETREYFTCNDHLGELWLCESCGNMTHSTWRRRAQRGVGGPDHCNNCYVPPPRDPAVADAMREIRINWAEGVAVPRARPIVAPARAIRNYTYKPDPKFFGRSRIGLFYGIEQEVESRHGVNHAQDVVDAVQPLDEHGLLYYKGDASMYDGVEIVSHPMSFAWFTQNYSEVLARKLQEVADNKYPWDGRDRYTCGVHIHASRSAFTGYHLFKFTEFFANNPAFIQLVAGRGDTCDVAHGGTHRIANFDKDALGVARVRGRGNDIIHSADQKIKNLAFAGKGSRPWDFPNDRYTAVNLMNQSTVEVRVFRGTVKIERLRGYMQFMDAVFKFTDGAKWHAKDPMRGLTEPAFRQFIKGYPRRYADLLNIINQVGVWAEA